MTNNSEFVVKGIVEVVHLDSSKAFNIGDFNLESILELYEGKNVTLIIKDGEE